MRVAGLLDDGLGARVANASLEFQFIHFRTVRSEAPTHARSLEGSGETDHPPTPAPSSGAHCRVLSPQAHAHTVERHGTRSKKIDGASTRAGRARHLGEQDTRLRSRRSAACATFEGDEEVGQASARRRESLALGREGVAMEIDAPTQPAGELGGCLRRPVCAPARRTARGLSWSTLAYFCVIVQQ